jgi:hypothetical protein
MAQLPVDEAHGCDRASRDLTEVPARRFKSERGGLKAIRLMHAPQSPNINIGGVSHAEEGLGGGAAKPQVLNDWP